MIPEGFRAADAYDLRDFSTLFHRDCGAEISRPSYAWQEIYRCKCGGQWLRKSLDKMTDRDIGDRFYVSAVRKVSYDSALVWVTEGKNRFVKSVPFDPADKRERFKP